MDSLSRVMKRFAEHENRKALRTEAFNRGRKLAADYLKNIRPMVDETPPVTPGLEHEYVSIVEFSLPECRAIAGLLETFPKNELVKERIKEVFQFWFRNNYVIQKKNWFFGWENQIPTIYDKNDIWTKVAMPAKLMISNKEAQLRFKCGNVDEMFFEAIHENVKSWHLPILAFKTYHEGGYTHVCNGLMKEIYGRIEHHDKKSRICAHRTFGDDEQPLIHRHDDEKEL